MHMNSRLSRRGFLGRSFAWSAMAALAGNHGFAEAPMQQGAAHALIIGDWGWDLKLNPGEAANLAHGQALSLVGMMGRIPEVDPDGGYVRAMADGEVLALCRLEDGYLKPERIIATGDAQTLQA